MFTQLKPLDPDRYLLTLFAPASKRDALATLYSINYEISKIWETVGSEPMTGFIRLQWWSETIKELYAGNIREHPYLPALAELISEYDLAESAFQTIITARQHDMDPAPFASLEALENYAKDTAGMPNHLASQILGTPHKEVIPIGTAWALMGIIRMVPYHLQHNRTMLPTEWLAEKGITQDNIVEHPALMELIKRLADHIESLLPDTTTLPVELKSISLQTIMIRHYLGLLRKKGFTPWKVHFHSRQLQLLWKLYRTAR